MPSLPDFRAIVGSTVSVAVDDSPRPLVVASVHDHARLGQPRFPAETFTVILDVTGADGPLIASATYAATHPALGAFTLFLVSHLAPGRDRPRYSATFSRI
jgi:hypothetical protein